MQDFAMEYRHPDDDAWYDVGLDFDGEKLALKYANLSEDYNEEFQKWDFKTMEELEGFKERFRLSSVQLQDKECTKIVQGKNVCVSHRFSNGEVKFFDAMVVEALSKEHDVVEDEEECFCTCVVKWQHGKLEGVRTKAKISDVCIIPPGEQLDSSLAYFWKMVKERIENNDGLRCKGTGHGGEPRSSYCLSRPVVNLEEFMTRLRRERKFRGASRSSEGRLNGGCKKIQQDGHGRVRKFNCGRGVLHFPCLVQ